MRLITRLTVVALGAWMVACASTPGRKPARRMEERNAVFELIPSSASPSISARVTNARTGDRLYGVPIQVTSTDLGALTDTLGIAEITNVAPGIYDLTVRVAGFQGISLKRVAVIDGFETRLAETRLEEVEIDLRTVEVR